MQVGMVEPHNNLLVKSGTDFREFTHLTLTLGPAGGTTSSSKAASGSSGQPPAAAPPDLQQGVEGGADYGDSEVTADGVLFSTNRPVMKWQQIQITSTIPDDPEAAQVSCSLPAPASCLLPGRLCALKAAKAAAGGWCTRGGVAAVLLQLAASGVLGI
jgi:hypothetical protein